MENEGKVKYIYSNEWVCGCGGKKAKDEASCLTMSLQSGGVSSPFLLEAKSKVQKTCLCFFFFSPSFLFFFKQDHRRHKHMEALTPPAEELS